MDKYKVLLVDDEEEAIEAIRLKLEWETLGFEVIGSANNGVKALELVERLQPDVVITDIKMPYMDGLELARALNEDYQNIHIIIFTGFDEFEYAKEAVHLEQNCFRQEPLCCWRKSGSSCCIRYFCFQSHNGCFHPCRYSLRIWFLVRM